MHAYRETPYSTHTYMKVAVFVFFLRNKQQQQHIVVQKRNRINTRPPPPAAAMRIMVSSVSPKRKVGLSVTMVLSGVGVVTVCVCVWVGGWVCVPIVIVIRQGHLVYCICIPIVTVE